MTISLRRPPSRPLSRCRRRLAWPSRCRITKRAGRIPIWGPWPASRQDTDSTPLIIESQNCKTSSGRSPLRRRRAVGCGVATAVQSVWRGGHAAAWRRRGGPRQRAGGLERVQGANLETRVSHLHWSVKLRKACVRLTPMFKSATARKRRGRPASWKRQFSRPPRRAVAAW